MIVYGRNPVLEALRGPREVKRIWATETVLHEPWLSGSGVPHASAGADELQERCGSQAHQGVCAEAAEYRYASADELLNESDPLIVALDQVQDPQNLGSICRTAECAGVNGIVIPERRAAEVTSAVCKASAGAVEHLRIARVRNLGDFLVDAKKANLWCYGAAAGAEASYQEVDLNGGLVLVLGAEGKGLRPRVSSECDRLISLPIQGRIEALNVGAAAAVLIYAALAARS